MWDLYVTFVFKTFVDFSPGKKKTVIENHQEKKFENILIFILNKIYCTHCSTLLSEYFNFKKSKNPSSVVKYTVNQLLLLIVLT